VEYEESDTIDEGVVIRTDVETGDEVEQGSTVTLVVSAGTQGVEVWEVTGYTYEEANNKLSSLGFLVNKAEAYSDTVDSGLVITQSPVGGSKAPKGSVITVTVSLGKEDKKICVPNLVGLTEQDGTVEAIEMGLQIGNVSYVYSSEVAEGYICYQSYSQGSYVDAGTALDIKVSQGKESITYKCNASITAPTTSEAPDYVSGTEVSIKLVTDDGKVLLDTKTSTFPQAANYYGLTSSGGTLTMTYKVTTAGSTTIDSDTGETISTPGTSEEKSFTRRIEFVQE
jgi:serine/threonine-protein kinase